MIQTLSLICGIFDIAVLLYLLARYLPYRKQKTHGFVYCLGMMAAAIAAAVFALVCWYVQDPGMLLAMLAWQHACAALSGTLLVLALLPQVGLPPDNKLRRGIGYAILAVPLAMVVLAATDWLHHLVVRGVITNLETVAYFYQNGTFSIVMDVFLYVMTAVVLIFAIIRMRKADAQGKKLLLVAMIAVLVPCVFSIIELLDPFLTGAHLASLILWVPALLVTYVFYGYLLSMRQLAISSSSDMYILFDRWGMCVDTNMAGRKFFKKNCGTPRPTFGMFSGMLGKENLNGHTVSEFELEDADVRRYYRATRFAASNSLSRHCADGFLLREVTGLREQSRQRDMLTMQDSLTGAYNRRYFYAHVDEAIEHAAQHGNVLALLMLDIDNFRKVNDKYGHTLGDEVLSRLCRLCGGELRRSDMFCRYGGEEFVILIEGRSMETGRDMARRIVEKVHDTPFLTSEGEIPITVSIGGFSMKAGEEDTIDKWIERASELLYIAKENGRDRVEYEAHTQVEYTVYAEDNAWRGSGI